MGLFNGELPSNTATTSDGNLRYNGSLASSSYNGALSAGELKQIETAVPGNGAAGFMMHPNQTGSRQGGLASTGTQQQNTGGFANSNVQSLLSPYGVQPGAIDASYVEGHLAGTKEQLAVKSDTREERKLGMEEETHGWQKNEYNRMVDIRQGMSDAAQAGGYTGVIDYLRTADPEKALSFEKQKLQLDQGMMESDTYKMAHSNDKLKVMVEGYSVLGKMGLGIMKAKPEDQAAMYQGILPMVKQVNPNAPDEWNHDAAGMMLLGASQAATPNLNAYAVQSQTQAQSATEKLNRDMEVRVARGETLENSQGLRNLYASQKAIQAKADQAQDVALTAEYKATQIQAQSAKDQTVRSATNYQLQSKMQADYDKKSKYYQDSQNALSKIKGQLQNAATNPVSGQDLKYSMARFMGGSGQISDVDLEAQAGQGSDAVKGWRRLQSVAGSGGQVQFTPEEVGWVKDAVSAVENVMEKKHQQTNDYFKNQAGSFSTPDFNIDLNYSYGAPTKAIELLQSNPSPEIKAQFQAKFGLDPNIYLGSKAAGQ